RAVTHAASDDARAARRTWERFYSARIRPEWEYSSDSDRIARMARTKPPKPARAEQASGEEAPNPVWFKPVMFGFMLLGLAWIIVFYVSQGRLPIADLGSWNILIGFGIAFVGFL